MSKNQTRRLSVLMTVYNCAEFLDEAIKSVLEQSFRDYEFIIINDASPDNAAEIIDHYAKQDNRIRVITNSKNINYGVVTKQVIKEAKGEYLAFAHGDDIQHPKRLEAQINFLDKNKQISAVSTRYLQDLDKYNAIIRKPVSESVSHNDREIKSRHLRGATLAITLLMFRYSLMDKVSFTSEYGQADDFMFYVNLSPHANFACLKAQLGYIRIHPNQVSRIHKERVRKGHAAAVRNHLSRFGIQTSEYIIYKWLFEMKHLNLNDGRKTTMITHIYRLVMEVIKIKDFYGYSGPTLRFRIKCVLSLRPHKLPLTVLSVLFWNAIFPSSNLKLPRKYLKSS